MGFHDNLLSVGEAVGVSKGNDVSSATRSLTDHHRDSLLHGVLHIQDGIVASLHHHQDNRDTQPRFWNTDMLVTHLKPFKRNKNG